MKYLVFSTLFLLLIVSQVMSQCSSYDIFGSVDISRCRQISKNDLAINVYVAVKEKGNKERSKVMIPVVTDGSLKFRSTLVNRDHAADSVVTITGWVNNSSLLFIPLSIPSSSFNCNTGKYKVPPNVIVPLVIDIKNCDPNELKELGKAALISDPYRAISYYQVIEEQGFDKTKEQRFNSMMALAAAYSYTGDFESQASTYDRLMDSVSINELSDKYQLQFWRDYYGNQCNLLGFSSLKTKEQKIDFNRSFGERILSNDKYKESWQNFLTAFKSSELAVSNEFNLVTDITDPGLVTDQKKILATLVKVKEMY